MANHYSVLGLEVAGNEDLYALARRVAPLAETIAVKGGPYLQWRGRAGEELWLQVKEGQELVGINPHYSGASSVPVRVGGRLERAGDTALDGSFHGWASPGEGDSGEGAYSWVFDAPDAAMCADLTLPGIYDVQIADFAHSVSYWGSLDAYDASQRENPLGLKWASQSFVPAGLFSGEGDQATASFTGHVVDSAIRVNSLTNRPYFWALVDTYGGS